MWHIWGKGEVNPEFWWGNLTERDHTQNLGIDGRTIWKWISTNEMGGNK